MKNGLHAGRECEYSYQQCSMYRINKYCNSNRTPHSFSLKKKPICKEMIYNLSFGGSDCPNV